MRAVCLWLAVIALICVTAPARAQPQAVMWQAPASCPDAAEVRLRIERRLGATIERALHGITVDIAVGRDGYVARIDLRGLTVENDVRELTSARCDELTDAIAIVLARVAAEVAAQPRPPEDAVEVADPLPGPGPAGPSPWRVGARVLGLSGIGAMPRVGLGGELAMFVRRDDAFVELVGAHWFPSAAVLFREAPGHVDIELTTAALRFGWAPVGTPVRAWIGAEVGAISGTGVDLGRNDMGSARWVAASAGVAVAWRMLPWLQLVGSLELAVPFDRPQFVLLDRSEVFRSEPATARSGLGLELSM